MDEQQYPRGDGSDIDYLDEKYHGPERRKSVRNQDRVFEAIRMSGGLLFIAIVLSAALAWHWMNMRFEATRAELTGKVECFDAMREKLSRGEGLEVPVPNVPREPARGNEPATEAPLREKR